MHVAEREREGLTAICLMAAFADGTKTDSERQRVARIAADLGTGELLPITQRVLLKQTDLASEVKRLPSPKLRQLAYEMAVCVCDADGACTDPERVFLHQLRTLLDLPGDRAEAVQLRADALAETPLECALVRQETVAPIDGPLPESRVAIEPMITRYAVLTGALELLPQAMAGLAIIPLQLKMVYRIGRHFGVELDRNQVKELLATVGIGLTGQVVESMARRLLSGFGRKVVGKKAARLVGGAAGPAITFATTFALGHVARAYYDGGRALSSAQLQELFAEQRASAQQLYEQYHGEIQAKARTINFQQLLPMIRGEAV